MINRRVACLALVLAAALPLAGCKVVSIAGVLAAEAPRFDGAAYAAELWESRALPHFSDSAHPAAEVLSAIIADLPAAGTKYGYRAGEGSPWSFIVSGTGAVTAKNTESRAGTLELSVAGVAAPVTLQIGPVIRGTAIRDALPFVSFKDFTNQIEYADAGKALTALALAGFTGNVESIAVGDSVDFLGAISMAGSTRFRPACLAFSMAGASDKILVTPVSIARAAP